MNFDFDFDFDFDFFLENFDFLICLIFKFLICLIFFENFS